MTGFVDKLASAIATQEGFFVAGSLPATLNNPGDLVFANQLNAVRDGPTWRFARFSSRQAGITALHRQILVYVAMGYTLRQLISVWAPPSENDTETYIRETARRVGIPDDKMPLWNYLELDRIP